MWMAEIRAVIMGQWNDKKKERDLPASYDAICEIIIRERGNGFKYAVNNQAAVDLYKERGVLPDSFRL